MAQTVKDLKNKINEIRSEYNKNSGIFYGFRERFDEVVSEINAIVIYLEEKEKALKGETK